MPEQSGGADGAPLRVILVGSSPLERSLRRDASVELIRARDTLAAVAELADPIDAASPDRTAIILTPQAGREADLDAFVQTVRTLAPQTRLLSVAAESDRQAPPPRSFDAALPKDADAAGLRATLALAEEADQSPREGPHRSVEEPAQQTSDAGPPSSASEVSAPQRMTHQTVVDTLLGGGDPLDACLREISDRLGDPSVRFIPADAEAPGPDAAAVMRRGACFGWLDAPGAPRQDVRREASWLASWLALREQFTQLRDAAFRDSLTGAWNRRYFEYFLPTAIDKARERRHDVTLMVYDIDDFKTYNDRFGHAAGDEILRETVRLMLSVIRPTDRVCRIGGDEFAVIFDDPRGPRSGVAHPSISINDIAARFQREVCAHRFPKLADEAPSTLTISGGLATFPWDGADAETLLQHADELALQSKRQGKNLITFGPGAERICRIRFEDVADEDGPADRG